MTLHSTASDPAREATSMSVRTTRERILDAAEHVFAREGYVIFFKGPEKIQTQTIIRERIVDVPQSSSSSTEERMQPGQFSKDPAAPGASADQKKQPAQKSNDAQAPKPK